MTVFDRMGSLQGTFGNTNAVPVNTTNGRVPFSTTLDITKNLPKNPGGINDKVEEARQTIINVSAANPALTAGTLGFIVGGPVGAAVGAGFGATIPALDKVSGGMASKALMAGIMEQRKNYAYVRDLAEKNAALGLLSGLTMVAGGVLGGVGGFLVGGPAGAWGGAMVGANVAGMAGRAIAGSNIGKDISNSAHQASFYANKVSAQQKYNFGRDVLEVIGKVPGFKTLGNTSKGIGAVTSGLLNYGFELGSPDFGAAKLGGAALRRKLVNPITEPMSSFNARIWGKGEPERIAKRQAANVDLINRTVAGEQTPYTPLFDFLENSKSHEVGQRAGFNNEVGQVAANVLAGRSREEIGLVFRVGQGDMAAKKLLEEKFAASNAKLTRYENTIATVEKDGIPRIEFLDKNPMALLPGNVSVDKYVRFKEEIGSLRERNKWLDDALKLDSKLTDRTVSGSAYIEKIRNDFARQNAARNLGAKTKVKADTGIGNIYQRFYQDGPFSKTIMFFDRITNDAPRQLINYNEPFLANSRVSATLRQAQAVGASTPEINRSLFERWSKAGTESDKNVALEEYVATGLKNLAVKHGVPTSVADEAVRKYLSANREIKTEAQIGHLNKTGYMNDPQDPLKLIDDPVLISQLANGYMLPDWKVADKALADYANKHFKDAKEMIKATELEGKKNLTTMVPRAASMMADELNSLWRTATLMRTGYPFNVVKDSHIRAWGDGAMFDVYKYLGSDALEAITSIGNTSSRIRKWYDVRTDKTKNIKFIRQSIKDNQAALDYFAKVLKEAKYDVNKPPKVTPASLLEEVDAYNGLQREMQELRRIQKEVVSGAKENKIGRQKLNVDGEEFDAAFAGRIGEIFMSRITQRESIRKALDSAKELNLENARRSRTGSHPVLPVEETVHLDAWQRILSDNIGNDPVAKMILEGKSNQEIAGWLRSPKGFDYRNRFGLRSRDSMQKVQEIRSMVDMYAPTSDVRTAILENKLTVNALEKMFPDINSRPAVFSDVVDDVLGKSSVYRKMTDSTKSVVSWLATQPTYRLAFSPYFRAKYEHYLQQQLWLSKANKRTLTLEDKSRMEFSAREYALGEYREKLNSFHRDMNYGGWMNYVLAFFPALVEQFRAYGRITMEHPEFLIKKLRFAALPEQFGNVETDANGNQYVEVSLPMYEGQKVRVPISWFNPDNPTGGDIISVHPFVASSVNAVAKKFSLDNMYVDAILPFGIQQTSINASVPNTWRRSGQAFQAYFLRSGEQFNRDVNAHMLDERINFIKSEGREPSPREYTSIQDNAEKRAVQDAILRFTSAWTAPVQGRVVTSAQYYVDRYIEFQGKFGENAMDMFRETYPEYYPVMDSLTDPISGVRADVTAVNLIKRNKDAIREITATIGEKGDLTVLGAIFNDDNYAFSSAAQAYLATTNIPGTSKKFKDTTNALQNQRSGSVSKGWNDFFKTQEVVSDVLKSNNIDPMSDYGLAILKKYKKAFVDGQKEANPLWYDEYNSQSFGGAGSRQADTIRALTIAIENDKLWADLSRQPKWQLILDYMQYRFAVNEKLQQMGTTIDSKKATFVRKQVDATVAQMKRQSAEFAKFYDRYFDNDKFDYVYEGV